MGAGIQRKSESHRDRDRRKERETKRKREQKRGGQEQAGVGLPGPPVNCFPDIPPDRAQVLRGMGRCRLWRTAVGQPGARACLPPPVLIPCAALLTWVHTSLNLWPSPPCLPTLTLSCPSPCPPQTTHPQPTFLLPRRFGVRAGSPAA